MIILRKFIIKTVENLNKSPYNKTMYQNTNKEIVEMKKALIVLTAVGSLLAVLKIGSANSDRVAKIKEKFKKN